MLVGRSFSVSFPVSGEDARAFYEYDHTSQTLKITAHDTDYIDANPDPFLYITVQSDSADKSTSMQSNAFGVTKEVTKETVNVLGLGSTGGAAGVVRGLGDEPFLMTKKIKMSPEYAREAVVGMTITFEGKLVRSKQGPVIQCATDYHSPTVSAPYDTTTNVCVGSAVFSRVSIASPKSGIVAEWKK